MRCALLVLQAQHISVPRAAAAAESAGAATGRLHHQALLVGRAPRRQGADEQVVCGNAGGVPPLT